MRAPCRSRSRAVSYRCPAAELETNSLFQVCTCVMSAKPPLVKARRRFSVDADLVVALHDALGIGDACIDACLVRVHRVTTERRQLEPVDDLRGGAPRLCELARDAPDLDDRQCGTERQHGRHLQQHLQLLADRDRRHLAERLDAVARLQQERATLGHLAQHAMRFRASPANTSGGKPCRRSRTASSAAESGQAGCCPAASCCHEAGVQVGSVIATDASLVAA